MKIIIGTLYLLALVIFGISVFGKIDGLSTIASYIMWLCALTYGFVLITKGNDTGWIILLLVGSAIFLILKRNDLATAGLNFAVISLIIIATSFKKEN